MNTFYLFIRSDLKNVVYDIGEMSKEYAISLIYVEVHDGYLSPLVFPSPIGDWSTKMRCHNFARWIKKNIITLL